MIDAQTEVPFFRTMTYLITHLIDEPVKMNSYLFSNEQLTNFLILRPRIDGRFDWKMTAFGGNSHNRRNNEKMLRWFAREFPSAHLHIGRILTLDDNDKAMLVMRSTVLIPS